MFIHLFNFICYEKVFEKNKWLITLGFVVVSAATGIDFIPVQKAIEETVNDSTQVHKSTDELGDSIVNDSVCYTTINSVNDEK